MKSLLKTNKDYKALMSLKEHINEVVRLETVLQEKKESLVNMRNTVFNYTDEGYPYNNVLSRLETEGQRFTFGLKLLWLIVVLIIIGAIFGGLIGLVFVLGNRNLIPEGPILDGIYFIVGGISVVVSVVLIILLKSKIKRNLIRMRYHRKINKSQKALEEAKSQSLVQIEQEKKALETNISALQKEVKQDEINLQGHHTKIEASITIPKAFLKHIDQILSYFEAYRAETIKEAINMYNEDEREKRFLTRLLYGIRMPEIPIEEILKDDFDAERVVLEIESQKAFENMEELEHSIAEETPETIEVVDKKAEAKKAKVHSKKREKLEKLKRKDVDSLKNDDLDYDIETVGDSQKSKSEVSIAEIITKEKVQKEPVVEKPPVAVKDIPQEKPEKIVVKTQEEPEKVPEKKELKVKKTTSKTKAE